MAQDIRITWVNPTRTVSGAALPVTAIQKVRIYERQPGVAAPVLARELLTQAEITAQAATLTNYYTTARMYEFAVSFVSAEGESALSPFGSDTVDVPQAGAAPVVQIVPLP